MTLRPLSSPRHAVSVTEVTLPRSGLQVALTERGARQTLEINDSGGFLISVISGSSLDPSVLRGAWRGVRDGQPWALAVGRSVSRPVSVAFSGRRLHLSARSAASAAVVPEWIGDFWLAEAAIAATRVTVTVAGVPAGAAKLAHLL